MYFQYYYNGQTGAFLYWDGERETYLLSPTSEQQSEQQLNQAVGKPDDESKSKKEKDKKEKVKVAKKIAKV